MKRKQRCYSAATWPIQRAPTNSVGSVSFAKRTGKVRACASSRKCTSVDLFLAIMLRLGVLVAVCVAAAAAVSFSVDATTMECLYEDLQQGLLDMW